MQTVDEVIEPATAVSEIGVLEGVGIAVAFLFWAIIMGWTFWLMFRAHRIVPKELKGIREALERIADQLEKDK